MITIHKSIVIADSPEAVFAFACNYANDPLWRAGVTEMRFLTESQKGKGAMTREVLRVFGQTVVTLAEVTEYRENQKIAFQSVVGKVPLSGYRSVEAVGAHSRFSYKLDMNVEGVYGWLARPIRSVFNSRVKKDLRRLKQLIETPGLKINRGVQP